MNCEINFIVENHLWMATSNPNTFYAASDDRLWLLTRDQLIDVYSDQTKPIHSLIHVSTIFTDLLYRFTTYAEADVSSSSRNPLYNCPRIIFGKRPLSKIHELNTFIKDRDYDIVKPIATINGHCIYRESLGHPYKLVLSLNSDKSICNHKLTILDTLIQELEKVMVKFCRYETDDYCVKCSLIEELWRRESKNTKQVALDYAVTKYLFS